MKSSQNLPAKLKEYRKKNHYSQEQLAEQMNLSRQAISNWETGKATPDIDNLVMLSELYGTSVDVLLGEEYCKDSSVDESSIAQPENKKYIEQIIVAVVLLSSLSFPVVDFFIPVLILVWLVYRKRNYKGIYFLCILCMCVGIYETLTVCIHLNAFYGMPIFIPK